MTEKRSLGFWHNPQISLGAHFDNVESISRPIPRIPEQSISLFPRHQQQRNSMNFFNLENTINFEQASKKSFRFFEKQEQPAEAPKNKQEEPIEEDSEIVIDQEQISQKIGLRYLSKLVYSALKKKKLTNQNQIVSFVESYILRDQQSKKTSDKESKNIKRRLYDALNVMTAAGAMEKDGSSHIYKSNTLQIPNKNSLSNKRDRAIKEVSKRHNKLLEKKMHLKNLHKKLQNLNSLIARNKKLKTQNEQCKNKKLKFPLILVNNIAQNQMSLQYNKQKQYLKICITGDVEMYADLDLAKIWMDSQLILSKSQEAQKIDTAEHQVQYQDDECLLKI